MALSKSLSSVEGATVLIDNADKIKKSYISLISLFKEKKDLVCNVYDNLSLALGCLLDPEEGYIFLARQLAGLSTLVTDALKLKTEIPKEMVPMIERLEECVDKAKQAVQNMKDRIEPLLKYLEDCIDKDIPINKNNVTRRLIVIDGFRDTCKDYLKKAGKAMSDLNNMASGKLLLCGIGLGSAGLTVTAVSGFLALYLGVKAAGTAAAIYGAEVAAAEVAAAGAAATGAAATGAAAAGAAATGTAATGAAATGAAAAGAAVTGAAASGAAATGAAATGAAAAGAAATGKGATAVAIIKSTVATLKVPVLAVGTAIGGIVACGKLFLLLADYAKWFNEVQSEFEKKLNSAQDELKEMERKVKMCKRLENSAQ